MESSTENFERYKIELERQKIFTDYILEMRRSTISLGYNVVKSALLINGGAAVALLAFIGNLLNKEYINTIAIAALAESMMLFGKGVACGALATGTTYVSQCFYDWCARRKINRTQKANYVIWDYVILSVGVISHIATIGLLIYSFICFLHGINVAYDAFIKYTLS